MSPLLSQKAFGADALTQQVRQWQQDGLRVVFTNGCFDLLHPGHVDYLHRASLLGDKLIVGLNSDDSVSRLKGTHRPIQDQTARATVLAGLASVNAVVFFDEDDPRALLSLLQPDVLVKGADYRVEEVLGGEEVMARGGSVVLLPYLSGYSTSAIERRIREAG